jgi:cytochrome c551/c552
VPFKCFKSLAILEDGSEFKYYGPGVGHIATEPNYSGGEQEKEELINVVKLSPKGLAEMSAEAIKLDKHARQEAKRVFGSSEPAERP